MHQRSLVDNFLWYNKTMKAFVSAQLKEKSKARFLYKRLQDAGISITHDWTQTDNLKNYFDSPTEAGKRAQKDIEGVCDADIYIILTDNESCGKGMYVELGAALALATTQNTIKLFLIGPKNFPSIFYFHPSIAHFDDLDAFFDHLSAIDTEAKLVHSESEVDSDIFAIN